MLPCEGQPPSHQLTGYPATVCTQYRETRLLSNDCYPQQLLPCEGQPPSHQLPGYPAAVCTQYRETRLLSNNCYPVRGSHPLTNYQATQQLYALSIQQLLPCEGQPPSHQLSGYPATVCTQYRETRLLSNNCYPVRGSHPLTNYQATQQLYALSIVRHGCLATTATL
ncbi:hypothetical protein J6590_060930 [Homalodisca vitripennis]|nr:hypothetical protein J6590_060930 [Homalodisca vitripennis]